MNLSITDPTTIASYLGAAAWLPQIISWIYKRFSKPVITIIPDKTVSIGYTTFGPIFNLRLSINTEKKSILIKSILIKIKHQNGERNTFEWVGMTEHLSEIIGVNNNQLIQRNNIPIALKVTPSTLVERFIKFQKSDFLQSNIQELDKLNLYLLKENVENSQNQKNFFQSINFRSYLDFMSKHFCWREGIYTVTFEVRPLSKCKINKQKFKFTVTSKNIEQLKNNFEEIKRDIHAYCMQPNYPNFMGRNGDWTWLNIFLEEKV